MEAIIRHGGKQYSVKEGMTIEVDYHEAQQGSPVEFSEVLYVGAEDGPKKIGSPLVQGAKVLGKVVGESRGPKLVACQFRRRKDSQRRIGHRQSYTMVKIESIQAG